MIRKTILLVTVIITLSSCLADGLYSSKHKKYIVEEGKDPKVYLAEKFEKHKIVILGEMHSQKDTLNFIKDSLSLLHKESDLRYFATEFVRSKNQEKINDLVRADLFDREAVIDIYRDFAWIWGYREYVDIIEEIWRINRSTDRNETIRIIAMDYEWKDWSGAADQSAVNRDQYMADRFLGNYTERGKALIHTGFNHSFLIYRQNGDKRMGNLLYDEFGDDIFQICLHHQMLTDNNFDNSGSYIPFYMDTLFRKGGSKPFGIDIIDSPLSPLRDDNSYFFLDDSTAVFQDVARGYIVLDEISEIEGSDWISGFITEYNFEKAKEIARSREWFAFDDDATIAELNNRYHDFMTSF